MYFIYVKPTSSSTWGAPSFATNTVYAHEIHRMKFYKNPPNAQYLDFYGKKERTVHPKDWTFRLTNAINRFRGVSSMSYDLITRYDVKVMSGNTVKYTLPFNVKHYTTPNGLI